MNSHHASEGRIPNYDQKLVMLHTLGLDRSDTVYRNYFSADPSHQDLPTLESCVEAGWMVKETSAVSTDLMFRVTAAGKAALLGRKAP